MVSEPFRVLFVCTGNICRSLIAEQAFRAAFGSTSISCESAGTEALVGEPMTPQAAAVARALGSADVTHEARRLTAGLIEASDLVLALTREHRASVARLLPRATRYTFTMREAVRLVESLASDSRDALPDRHLPPADFLRALVPRLAAQRGFAAPPFPNEGDDDVIDPFRQPDAIYDQVKAKMFDAMTRAGDAISALAVPAATT